MMKHHTDEEIEAAARRFEQLADEFDPEAAEVDDTEDLRDVARASDAERAVKARLREAVEIARAHSANGPGVARVLGHGLAEQRAAFCADRVGANKGRKRRRIDPQRDNTALHGSGCAWAHRG